MRQPKIVIISAGLVGGSAALFAADPLAVKLAADQGVSISWLDWAVAASVPGLRCLAIIPVALLWITQPQIRRTPAATASAQRELRAMGPITAKEIVMAAIFLGLLVLWIFGAELGIGATLAAALGVCLLFVTGVLTWQDALNEESAWDTMIWIGLLIMLASKLNEYGMVSWFGKEFGVHLEGFPRLAVYMMVAAIYCYVHYFFASATAHISALFPLCMALMVAAGHVRRWLRHTAAMVERWLSYEPDLHGCLASRWPTLVDASWARLRRYLKEKVPNPDRGLLPCSRALSMPKCPITG